MNLYRVELIISVFADDVQNTMGQHHFVYVFSKSLTQAIERAIIYAREVKKDDRKFGDINVSLICAQSSIIE